MKVHFTCRRTSLTPAIRSFTEDKLERLSRYLDEGSEVHVVLAVEKHRHQAEMMINSSRRHFAGTAITEDLYSAVGLVLDKLEKQLRRDKTRRANHRRRLAREAVAAAGTLSSGNGREQVAQETGIEPDIQPARQMTVAEAAANLERAELGFVVFRNADTDRMSVLYRHLDGRIGLVEAE
jgi:putative sigma-54 modulation protein